MVNLTYTIQKDVLGSFNQLFGNIVELDVFDPIGKDARDAFGITRWVVNDGPLATSCHRRPWFDRRCLRCEKTSREIPRGEKGHHPKGSRCH